MNRTDRGVTITFQGGAGEVTGSCYLVETPGVRFLVDCGMFQGGREASEKNYSPFAFDPGALDFVLLTHAHIDHSGLLPRLCAQGFRGPIYTTAATVDLLEVMLLDSAHIQEKEAEWRERMSRRGKHEERKHPEPLYTVSEAEASLKQLHAVDYDATRNPHPRVSCRFREAGHILGAAIIEVWVEDRGHTRKLVFSGDIGQPGHPVVRDPMPVEDADYLLIESTYGNRLHKPFDATLAELEHALKDTLVHKHGNVIVPAFAVGRTQDLLYALAGLYREGRLPEMHIYVDSPMALKVTEIMLKHAELLDPETRAMLAWWRSSGERLHVNFVHDVEESMALARIKSGAVIISASGMCNAGRIKHHLANNLGRRECSILITGFQANGTLGRRIVDGARTVRIFGEEVAVRAAIYTIGGLSAHADQAGLLAWLGHFRKPPRATFVVHGERDIAQVFATAIRERLQWPASVPDQRSSIALA